MSIYKWAVEVYDINGQFHHAELYRTYSSAKRRAREWYDADVISGRFNAIGITGKAILDRDLLDPA